MNSAWDPLVCPIHMEKSTITAPKKKKKKGKRRTWEVQNALPKRSLSLWYDKWATKVPSRALIQGPLVEEEEKLRVKDVFGLHEWDW